MPAGAGATAAAAGGDGRGRPWLRHAASLLVAGACLGLALRGVDLPRLGTLVAAASVPLLLASGLLSVAMNGIKCLKIGVLLAPVYRVPYRTLLGAELISVLVDTALPFRLLELVKAYLIGRVGRIGAPRVLGGEVVEKGLETLFLLAMVLLLGLTQPLPPWLQRTLVGGLAAVAAAAVALALLTLRPVVVEAPLRRLAASRWPAARPLSRALRRLTQGMRLAAGRPHALLLVLALTAVEWSVLAGCLGLCAAALDVDVAPQAVLAMLVAHVVSFAVPTSTSASLGIYELAGKTALVALCGMDPARALALVVVFHAVLAGFGILAGAAALAASGVSLREVRRGAR